MSPRIETAEAKLHHCGQISRAVRSPQLAGAGALGLDAHRELRRCFEASCIRQSYFIDGKLAAMWGLTGTLSDPEGHVWLALNNVATQYPFRVAREAVRSLRGIFPYKHRLTTTIVGMDWASRDFAERMGFHVVHPLPLLESDIGINMEIRRDVTQGRKLRTKERPSPFMLFSAGRSRTNWLANFLTYSGVWCYAEVSRLFRDLDTASDFMRTTGVGCAETGVAPAWRLLKHRVPNLKMVVIRRPEDETVQSFLNSEIGRQGLYDEDRLRKIIGYECRCLDQISQHPDTLTVQYRDLSFAYWCKQIFEFCLPYEFDMPWWEFMARRNIQADARDVLGYYVTNRPGVEAFKREAKREMIRLVRSGELRKDVA